MIENKEIILSTSRNLNFYLLDYKEREVQNELDLVNNTLILSKLNNNENIYLNNFEDVIHLKKVIVNTILDNIVIKQENKLFIIQDKRDNLDISIPLSSDNKIYIYKDYKTLDLLSQEKSTFYTFQDTDLLTDYEVLEVKFNGKRLDSYTFDKVLKQINLSSNNLDFQYLNNIQVILAKKIDNINDVIFKIEHIDHAIFDKKNPMEVVANTYYNLSYIMVGYDFKRGNYESFEKNNYRQNKATHKVLKNHKTEINIKIRNTAETFSDTKYNQGLYNQGLYSGINNSFSNVLSNQKRFRFIIFDTLSGEITIVNNCKTNEDYSTTYSDDSNIIEFTINGDKEIRYISETNNSKYTYYKKCSI